jgi:hypothetical protein
LTLASRTENFYYAIEALSFRLQPDAKRLIDQFIDLDERVMARQRKTGEWWSTALKRVLSDPKTPQRLKAAYSALR